MAQFMAVPYQRLQDQTLQALLEEFASRDGTDYGETEFSLVQKVAQLRLQMKEGQLQLLYDAEGDHWDLLPSEQAALILDS